MRVGKTVVGERERERERESNSRYCRRKRVDGEERKSYLERETETVCRREKKLCRKRGQEEY